MRKNSWIWERTAPSKVLTLRRSAGQLPRAWPRRLLTTSPSPRDGARSWPTREGLCFRNQFWRLFFIYNSIPFIVNNGCSATSDMHSCIMSKMETANFPCCKLHWMSRWGRRRPKPWSWRWWNLAQTTSRSAELHWRPGFQCVASCCWWLLHFDWMCDLIAGLYLVRCPNVKELRPVLTDVFTAATGSSHAHNVSAQVLKHILLEKPSMLSYHLQRQPFNLP